MSALEPSTVLVLGEGALALAITRRLQELRVGVASLPRPASGTGGAAGELELLPSALSGGSGRSPDAIVLAADDDGGNMDRVFAIRRLRPELPIVVRLFDPTLGSYLRRTLPGVAVLGIAQVAAPVVAATALEAIRARGGHPVRCSAPHGRRALRGFRSDRVLVGMVCALVLLVAGASLFFARALGLRWLDAFYFVWTTITTVGYGDIALKDASSAAKVVGIGVMFAGAAFMASLFAFFTEWIVARRLLVLRGRVQVGGHGHVLVAGAGHVGFRSARLLAEQGLRVVVVEMNPDNGHLAALRAAGHQVIVADAAADDTLDLARIGTAAAVIAVTDSDAANLRVALQARARCRELPVIVRVESPALSAHIRERKDGLALSPIELATEQFVRTALGAERVEALRGAVRERRADPA